jgi:drug/metabolite transporter (DMT)-like permease
MMFYVMTSGWLLTTIFMFSGAGFEEIALLNRDGWIGVLFLGVACSGIAYIGWYDALQVLPASQAGAFIYLEPLVTVIVSAVVLSEPVSLASLLGGGTILVGVWLVNRFPQRKLALSEERSE